MCLLGLRGESFWGMRVPECGFCVRFCAGGMLFWVWERVCVGVFVFGMQNTIASKGRGILAMDESNATCGLRLASIGLENTEVNRQAYRQLLCTTPGLGEYISGAIMFEETLYQSTSDGKKMVDCLSEQNIVPGIKVDKVKDLRIPPPALLCMPLSFILHFLTLAFSLCACFRVSCLLQAQTTSPGARVLMVWLQGPLLITSRERGLPNGE